MRAESRRISTNESGAQCLAVLVSVTVPRTLNTGLVRPAALLPSSAHSAQGLRSRHLQHHHLLTPVTSVRQGVLQEGEAGQLALERLRVVTEGVTVAPSGLYVVQALVGTPYCGLRLHQGNTYHQNLSNETFLNGRGDH